MSAKAPTLAEVRKGLIALVAAAGEAASLGLLPDPWSKYAAVLVAAAAAAGVYGVPNGVAKDAGK